MWSVEVEPTFASFREGARALLAAGVHPREVVFCAPGEPSLFPRFTAQSVLSPMNVPRALLDELRLAALHADPRRHDVLYRLLWRQCRGDVPRQGLLADKASPDVASLAVLARAVRQDVHHMHAFVRFREVREQDDSSTWIAFHRPDHHVVEEAAPFFARRYNDMRWSILTPRVSAFFDPATRETTFGPPAHAPAVSGASGATGASSDATQSDPLDELWRTYYASVFNPSRVSPKTTRMHLPTRHHATLPEARVIPALIREARARSLAMIDTPVAAGARAYLPADRSLSSLAQVARSCEGCELAGHATQTVFGEGPADAQIALVGEQPGNDEDLSGRPFVGPAGQVLDRALIDAGIARDKAYLTNTVKHFRFKLEPLPRSERTPRIHERPRAGDVRACRPWLEAELVTLRPKVLVCLGATAARALVHPRFEVTKQRGVVGTTAWAPHTIVTFHPSAVLRADGFDGDDATAIYAALVDDLRAARTFLAAHECAGSDAPKN